MVTRNPIQDKAYEFALNIVDYCRKIMREEKEYVLSKQVLRSGTSIGANIEEAQQAESKKDFISKMSISLKEAYETRYWIILIRDSGIETEEKSNVLFNQVQELIRMLVAIIKTSKFNLYNSKK
ncbi:MAG: four helix bundle protein [Candidatus Peribacteraceae bacterium]|jgi:four helix bundle protein|nr:four helix bundle protein [Candidatus Peribacteraceae bacterium]HCI04305.1 four helix bundle protein [Candidatus Peribacteria bacterium]|tara:strand:- start:3974 stop:4345 length:372 start_codon:yes stop_codon:yes gene_type:complete